MKKAIFVFPTNRQRTLEMVRDGVSPDNELYGFNYFESLGQQVLFADVSPTWQDFLDKVFFPLGRLFRRQIDITFQLGRALLMLPAMNKAGVVVTNTDSIGLPVCFLKRLGLVRPPVVYAVGLFYIQGRLKEAVDAGKKTLFRSFYTWILSAAGHIVYHSPIEKEKLIKLGLYSPAYCTFVAMGSDQIFFRNIKRSDLGLPASSVDGRQGRTLRNKKLILAVGRDHARDYQTLFEAAKKLSDTEFRVICSQRNIKGLKIPQNVKVLFDVTYSEVADWYGQATAVVIPMKEMHRSSGQMTLTDAIQTSKPIVVTDVIGIAHYKLQNGVNALLIPPGNADKLAQAVSDLTANVSLRRRLIYHTQKLKDQYTTENYATRLFRVIKWATDPVHMRQLQKKDLEFVRKLRNRNRQYFFHHKFISRDDQQKWFDQYQRLTDDKSFILEANRIPIGFGSIYMISRQAKTAMVGRFMIDESKRGRGYGKILLRKIEYIARSEMGLQRLELEVLEVNQHAIHIYRRAGYMEVKSKNISGKSAVLMAKLLTS